MSITICLPPQMVAATTSLTCLSLESATASLSAIGGCYDEDNDDDDDDNNEDNDDEDDASSMLKMLTPPFHLGCFKVCHGTIDACLCVSF